MKFQDDILHHVLSYVGPNHFRFMASVSKQWKRQYHLTHGPMKKTGRTAAVCSLSTMILYTQEKRNPSTYSTFRIKKMIGKNGDLQMIQWLRARNRLTSTGSDGYGEGTMPGAVHGGHLGMIKWLRANGYDWGDYTCAYAALGGHLEVLKWARAKGCDWDTFTCPSAAKGGHLEVLKWARAHGCGWDEDTCSKAAEGGHLEVLKWARANGCQWLRNDCVWAARRGGHDEMEMWIQAHH